MKTPFTLPGFGRYHAPYPAVPVGQLPPTTRLAVGVSVNGRTIIARSLSASSATTTGITLEGIFVAWGEPSEGPGKKSRSAS